MSFITASILALGEWQYLAGLLQQEGRCGLIAVKIQGTGHYFTPKNKGQTNVLLKCMGQTIILV